jgi:hypothetical protein
MVPATHRTMLVLRDLTIPEVLTITAQNSPYMCSCLTSCPGNSVYTYSWVSLHCCQSIMFLHCRHVLHSVVSRNQSAPNFRASSQMFCDMNSAKSMPFRRSSTAAVLFPLQKPHTGCMSAHSLCVNRLGRPPLWSSEWSEFLATDPEVRVRFPALPKKSCGSGTGSTQPREYKLRSYLIEK